MTVKMSEGCIIRTEVRKNKDIVYVYSDNIEGLGYGNQARELRGEPNAIGIPTKWRTTTKERDYFHDNQFEIVKPHIDMAFDKIDNMIHQGKDIIFLRNIGRGMARLPEKAPKTLEYIEYNIQKRLRD